MRKIMSLLLICLLILSTTGCTQVQDSAVGSVSESNPNGIAGEETDGEIISDEEYAKLLEGNGPDEELAFMQRSNVNALCNEILYNLTNENMFFRGMRKFVDEGTELENGYTSYQDGAILCKVVDSRVRNLVFTDKYEGYIMGGYHIGDGLEEAESLMSGRGVGSVSEGYLGYRTNSMYMFFYDNEVSVYGYYYSKPNDFFEKILTEYIENKDLDYFIEKVSQKWGNAQTYEYDKKKQYAHIVYPERGVEIYIKDNNTKGVLLYSNYYFSKLSKQLIEEGKVTLKADEDLIVKTEAQRREKMN